MQIRYHGISYGMAVGRKGAAGIQFKGIEKLPLRLGYTYSSNPIRDEVAFFNVPAAAVIKHAFQFGLSLQFSSRLDMEAVYHHGRSGEKTSGPIYSPFFVQDTPPYGAIPGTEVGFDMTTSMVMVGLSYRFKRKSEEDK